MAATPKAADKPKTAVASVAEATPLPEYIPGQPAPDGEVHVTTTTETGSATESKPITRGPNKKKADSLKGNLDFTKLPVAVSVGQINASVEEYSGRAILSLSLVGWVGDPALRILAEDAEQIDTALAELRKQLA